MHPDASSSTTSASESILMPQDAVATVAAVAATTVQVTADGAAFGPLRQDAPPATSMDEEGANDSAPGAEETESSSSSSRSTLPIFDQYDKEDD